MQRTEYVLKVELFDYALDPALIADHPPDTRDGGRLLVVSDTARTHTMLRELTAQIAPGSLVVLNDTRVLPARLLGSKAGTGGRAEIMLIRQLVASMDGDAARHAASGFVADGATWLALGRASKGLGPGTVVVFERCTVHVLSKSEQDGTLTVKVVPEDGETVIDAVERIGKMPLPPYIRRLEQEADRERYQTVFARSLGAVAAPTAGLHITEEALALLRDKGCEIAHVTLHVGLGTFQSVTADDLDAHPMHSEWYEVPEVTVAAIERARLRKSPVVAVGTTAVRALESAAAAGDGRLHASSGMTALLIQPGYTFRVVDRLLTNFHLPKSTLLALVCAFGGLAPMLEAYAEATRERYRFFSYGDAMLIDRQRAP